MVRLSDFIRETRSGLSLRTERLLNVTLGVIAGAIAQTLIAIPVSLGESAQLALNTIGGLFALTVETYASLAAQTARIAFGESAAAVADFQLFGFAAAVATAGLTGLIIAWGVRALVE